MYTCTFNPRRRFKSPLSKYNRHHVNHSVHFASRTVPLGEHYTTCCDLPAMEGSRAERVLEGQSHSDCPLSGCVPRPRSALKPPAALFDLIWPLYLDVV